jgi:preprotein translocase subunit SecA
MALLNAAGNPVGLTKITYQFDVPGEEAAKVTMSSINWLGVITAVLGLVAAMATGNPTTIMAAMQALLTAILGGG